MADDTTTPDTVTPPSAAGMDPAMLQRLIAQLTTTAAPQAAPQPSASSHEGRGFLSLLGEALGGGQTYGSTAEREQGGLSAAQVMGLRMMQASDYSYQPHTLGSIVAQGALGARESLGQTQAVSAARAAAAYDQQRQGQQDQLARIKEAIPLLTLQGQQAAGANAARIALGGSGGGGGGGGGIGTAGGGDGSFLSALAGIESGDQNIVSRVDKDSKGLTLAQGGNPAEISQGHFQINPGTWRDFAKAAGVDVTQYPTPMSAPREVQAQVASVIPLARFGPRTQEMLRQKFGDLDTSRTIGALNGARAPAAPGQQPGAAPLPPAVKVAGPGAGNLPTPPVPPAVAPPMAPAPTDPETGAPVTGGAVVGAQTAPPAPTPGPGAPTPPSLTPPPLAPPVAAPPAAFTPRQLTPSELAATSYDLTPQQQAHFRQQIAETAGAPDQVARIAAIEAAKATAIATQREKADAARLAIEAKDRATYQANTDEQAKFDRDNAAKQAAVLQAQQADREKAAEAARQAVELEKVKNAGTIEQQAALVSLEGDKKRMDKMGEAAATALPVADSIRQLVPVIKSLPPDGKLSGLITAYPQLTAALKAANIINPETADNLTLFRGLTEHLSTQLRVSGTGSMSDTDLATFKSSLPSLIETPAGRLKAAAFLQNLADRVVQEQEFTQEHFRRIDPATGKPSYNLRNLNDAMRAPRRLDANGHNVGGLGEVVPHAPAFPDGEEGYKAAREWLRTNVESGHPYTVTMAGKDVPELRVRE